MKMQMQTVLAAALLLSSGARCLAAPDGPPARIGLDATLVTDWRGHNNGLAFTPDGKTLISEGGDGTVQVWDVAGAKKTAVLGRSREIRGLALTGVTLSPDGKIVVSYGYDGTVKLWEVASGEHLATFKCGNKVYAAVFAPDGKTLSVVEETGYRIWDVEKRKEVRLIRAPGGPVLTYSGVKRPVFFAGDKTFILVDAFTGESILGCGGHPGGVGLVAMDREGTLLASASREHSQAIGLWDRNNGELTATFRIPPGVLVRCLAFSPDRQILAVAYNRHGVGPEKSLPDGFRIYEVPGGKVLAEEEEHGVRSIAFSPDGRLMATGGSRLNLWTVPAAWRKKK